MQVETRTDPRFLTYHWISFRRGPREQGSESDVDTVHAGRIAVTPLRYDRTDEEAYAMLAKALPRCEDRR
jgi:5'-nucleotidase